VTIIQPFAVGKFAVSFAEWDVCVADGGCNGYWPGDHGWGRGDHPVINVSWDDAKLYIAWLARITGKEYRLLSETEREYVTRANKTTPYWWSPYIISGEANYHTKPIPKLIPINTDATVSVSRYRANAWGLFNVHGNVWEWTEDCWNESNRGNPGNGTARTTGDCSRRVARGGSWNKEAQYLRAANRFRYSANGRYNELGFRLARALNP
jgi:formylglycine-generating enzyme required for sulfatase activity